MADESVPRSPRFSGPDDRALPPAAETYAAPRFASDGDVVGPPPPPNPTPEQIAIATAASVAARQLPHEVYEARVAIVAGLKRQGYTRQQIAKALKMSVNGVDWAVREARKRGELQRGMEEALARLDDEAIPLALEGMLHHLKQRDKDVCLEVLQGRGLLKTYSQVKNEGGADRGPNMAFQFNFVMPEGRAPAPIDAVPGELSTAGTKQIFGVERTE